MDGLHCKIVGVNYLHIAIALRMHAARSLLEWAISTRFIDDQIRGRHGRCT